jgi:hypothetical protein
MDRGLVRCTGSAGGVGERCARGSIGLHDAQRRAPRARHRPRQRAPRARPRRFRRAALRLRHVALQCSVAFARGARRLRPCPVRAPPATRGPNAMVLPLPAKVMPGPGNVVDTRGFRRFLDDIHDARCAGPASRRPWSTVISGSPRRSSAAPPYAVPLARRTASPYPSTAGCEAAVTLAAVWTKLEVNGRTTRRELDLRPGARSRSASIRCWTDERDEGSRTRRGAWQSEWSIGKGAATWTRTGKPI